MSHARCSIGTADFGIMYVDPRENSGVFNFR